MTLQEQLAELEKVSAEIRRVLDGMLSLSRALERILPIFELNLKAGRKRGV